MEQRVPVVMQPGHFRPTSARGRRTRARLLEAARETFLSEGYRNTTVRAITEAAGVGYGSFYVYFSSRLEIFVEITRDIPNVIGEGWDAAHDERLPLQEQISVANRRYFELYREHAPMLHLMEEASHVDAEFRAVNQQLRAEQTVRSATRLRELQQRGLIDISVDPTYLAHGLGALAERLAYLGTTNETLDIEKLLSTLDIMWWRGLGVLPET